jgi:hypothetical protein
MPMNTGGKQVGSYFVLNSAQRQAQSLSAAGRERPETRRFDAG